MDGDAIVWIVLLLSIVICDYLASYLYKHKKIPIWASAIGMALLIPVIVGSFMYLGINYGLEPGDTGEGVAFAGGFMVLILAFNAIIMFVIGVILNIYTFVKNKRKI
ncbi:hypothetical protein ACQKMI_19815 [Lysinibacillus sp. NPDC097214]|uniref:hypothetical protein n=1 Tax=Lysinibacillus sp. NPDC097214 TaxID=3390584 RepID=UPI003D027DE6